MAEAQNGMLGGVSGKVGPVVGVQWRGRYYWRTVARKSNKSSTDKQLCQQAKMTLVSTFLAKARPFINKYTPRVQGKRTLINGTEQQSSYLLKHAVGFVDNVPYLQLNEVTMSVGTLPAAHIYKIELTEDKKLKLYWEDNSYNSTTKTTDLLSIVLFHDDFGELNIYENIGKRVDTNGDILLPESWQVGVIHIWSMWKDESETLNSTSLYHGEHSFSG